MSHLKADCEWLRAGIRAKPENVDRSKGIIYGVIGAEEGQFKTQGRGEFDRQAIREIVRLGKAKPAGLKSRLGHPTASGDSLGKFLGRHHNPRSVEIMRQQADGSFQPRLAAKFDLHIDPTAYDTPNGNLGKYILDLAESDSDAFGASLVIQADKEFRLDKQGRALKDATGLDLPPLWRPKVLHALDAVDEGDATNSFLSAGLSIEGLPDEVAWYATELLEKQFGGEPADVVRTRCIAWLDKFLTAKYGSVSTPAATPPTALAWNKLRMTEMLALEFAR